MLYYCDVALNTKCNKDSCFIYSTMKDLMDGYHIPINKRNDCYLTSKPEYAKKDSKTGEPIVFESIEDDWKLYLEDKKTMSIDGKIFTPVYEAIPNNITAAYAIVADLKARGLIKVQTESSDKQMKIQYQIVSGGQHEDTEA